MNDKIIIAPCGLKYKKEYYYDPVEQKTYKYILLDDYLYYSIRYNKYVFLKKETRSDGATGAFDIPSCSWWIHDELCKTGTFKDETLCINIQASFILYDILLKEKRYIRCFRWFIFTFLFGGGKARKNGMFSLRDDYTNIHFR